MIATFWDLLFGYADEQKKVHGVNSKEYKITHEIENLLQEAYDKNNKVSIETMEREPKDKDEEFVFKELPEVKVFIDCDGYRYELDGKHFDSAPEILHYIITDRRQKYKQMNARYNNKFKKAIRSIAAEWYINLKGNFMTLLGYSEDEFMTGASVAISDTQTKNGTSMDEAKGKQTK